MKIYKILSLSAIILVFIACNKDDKTTYPDIPEITFSHLSNNVINFSDTASFVDVNFSLIDGDKDIGVSLIDTAIKIDEYRSDTLYRQYQIGMPLIPSDYLTKKYLDAKVRFILPGVAFTPRLDQVHINSRRDTFYLKFWVTDEAGNKSNIEQTPPIYIQE